MGQKLLTNQFTFVVILILQCSLGLADYPKEIEISTIQKSIRVGEPFVFQLKYIFEQPQITANNGQLREYFRHNAYLDIEYEKTGFSTAGYKLFPQGLILKDPQNIEYSEYFICFYNPGKKRLIFPVAGRYSITVRGWGRHSETLDKDVKPSSPLEQRALSLLSDPNDFFYLETGEHDYDEKHPYRTTNLEEVVEKCEGTLIAKWCAARLGIESFKQFQDNHTSYINYDEERQKELLNGSQFKDIYKYLTIGAKLSDEFPIREEVLKELAIAEFIKGNHEKAYSLLDELGNKYPKGEHGRRALKDKQELIELQKGPN